MEKAMRVDFFIPVPTCACSGAAFTRDMDRITRLEKLMEDLEDDFPDLQIVRHAMSEEESYSDNLKLLASLLRKAGEEDFADRVAFSLRYVLPAVAVDGDLVAFGRVPDEEEVSAIIEERGKAG